MTEYPGRDGAPDPNVPVVGGRSLTTGEGNGVIRSLVLSRLEILSTLIMDGGLLVLATWVRTKYLGLLGKIGDRAADWVVHAMELMLDYGVVATMALILAFDLLKRIRIAWEDWKR